MVIIRISDKVILSNLDKYLLDKVRLDLLFTEKNKVFRYYDIKGNKAKVPKGYVYFFKQYLVAKGYPYQVIDDTLETIPVNFTFQKILRAYQHEALLDATKYPCGVIESATGSGKTVIALGIICVRRQNTLVVVHTKELLYQWRDRIKEFIGIDCGLIGDGNDSVSLITVGIINSVKNNIPKLREVFGHIIVDEVHRCPSKTYTETLLKFPARYLLGLSATPYRRDSKSKLIYYCIGPKMHTVDLKSLQKEGAVLKPKIIRVATRFNIWGSLPYDEILELLVVSFERNQLIKQVVLEDRKYPGTQLIITNRKDHCDFLAGIIDNSVVLHGDVSKSARIAIVEGFRNKEYKTMIATTSLICEGFDVSSLTSIFMVSPIRFSGRVIQAIGRILRPEKNKVPRVYDFRDDLVSMFWKQGMARDKVYQKEWNDGN